MFLRHCLIFVVMTSYVTTTPQSPHIIFMMMDDLGFNDIGYNNDDILTPHLDEMATQGVILNQAYAQPVCSPSRGAILTGMYPFHIGLQHNMFLTDTQGCLKEDQPMLQQKLKELGYSTNLVGKWHLGHCNWHCTPTYRGFDTFFGFYNGYVDHYTHDIDGGYDWWDGVKPSIDTNGTYSTDLIRDRTVNLIQEHDPDTPLFLMISWAAPHYPIQAPQKYLNLYPQEENHQRLIYKGMVTAVDDATEDIIHALKSTGIYDKSIIIFMSDNGGEAGPSSNAPLRGGKGTVWEGGIRVPTFIHSPYVTQNGIITDGLFHATDWYPTILGWAGGGGSGGTDGVNQHEMLLHGAPSGRYEIPLQIDTHPQHLWGYKSLRYLDWKLILGFPGLRDGWDSDEEGLYFIHEKELPDPEPQSGQGQTEAKKHHYSVNWAKLAQTIKNWAGRVQLYNLADDPAERVNLVEQYPAIVDTLRQKLEDYVSSELPSPPMPRVPEKADYTQYGGVWSPGWC